MRCALDALDDLLDLLVMDEDLDLGSRVEAGDVLVASKSVGYWLTVTETSAGGGIRSVTSVIFFEWMEMRFVQSENMPFE